MAKLTKAHLVEMINRAIAGEDRASIAKDMPVVRGRVSKILCDMVDGTLTDSFKELLADVLTPEVLEKLKSTMPVGRSKKNRFINYAEATARDDRELENMLAAWQDGYGTGYNLGRNSK